MKRIALVAGIGIALTIRCAGADTLSDQQPFAMEPLLVKVEVVSKTYGDFSEQRLLPVGEPVSFGPYGESHPQFNNPNNCRMNSADVPVVDGVKIDVERETVLGGDRVQARIVASGKKFLHYGPPAHFGWCGDVRLASSMGFESTETVAQFQLGRPVTISDPTHDLNVTVTFLVAE